jgi:uncharacterized repeat protein (TIGR01451 family)
MVMVLLAGCEQINGPTGPVTAVPSEIPSLSTSLATPDLRVTKRADSTVVTETSPKEIEVAAGREIRYRIGVKNWGTASATGVAMVDTLPIGPGIDWIIEEQGAAGPCKLLVDGAFTILRCEWPTALDPRPGSSSSRAVTVMSKTSSQSCGVYRNRAHAWADNNRVVQDSATIRVVNCPADLQLRKTPDQPRVAAGDPMSFVLEVSNAGPGTAMSVVVSDELPTGPGIRWIVVTPDTGCRIDGDVLTCNFGDMPGFSSRLIKVTSPTTTESCGTYQNRAAVRAGNHGTVHDSASIVVQCAPATAAISGCVYPDWNGTAARDIGLGRAGEFGIFVINGGELIMNSSNVWGDVAIGPRVDAKALQKTNIRDGAFHFHSGTTRSVSEKDFLVQGGFQPRDLAGAQADANTASSAFAAMTPTESLGDVTRSVTLTGNGGLNVIGINSLTYKSRVLELRGGANDVFVINVAGHFEFAQSEIRLTGVTPGQVVFNFPTAGNTILLYKAENIIQGTFLAPQRDVNYHNPAVFNGAIVARGLNIHSMGNLRHVPTTFQEPCLAGVTVELANAVTRTTVSTVQGYAFLGLPASTYTVTLSALPSGYSYLQAFPGRVGGVTTGTAVQPRTVTAVVLPGGGVGSGYDFAVRRN